MRVDDIVVPGGSHKFFPAAAAMIMILVSASDVLGQSSVSTQHYDIARTGAYTGEGFLTPSNVNSSSFGRLFFHTIDGYAYAQPLVVPGLVMGAGTRQAGTKHNVVFIATEHDSVYAFDADNNAGANAFPLWQASMLSAAHGAAAGATTVTHSVLPQFDIVPEVGITGTPVIDTGSSTLYVVSKTFESNTYVYRLHALDLTTGNEKSGGPVVLSGSVKGNGTGSSGGVLHFDAKLQNQRSGLLLLNGILYIAFGSHEDTRPWHGWILAYNASTLHQTGSWCSTPNDASAGIWMAGAGLAADVPSGKPYGRLFIATGNGAYDAVAPNYNNTMDYGDSVIRLDLTNGVPSMVSGSTTVGDEFTPNDQFSIGGNLSADQDQGSGGVLLLPDAAGGGKQWLLQGGKQGHLFQIDRNSMGGYHPNDGTDPQDKAAVGGLFSTAAYWNSRVYIWGSGNHLKQFSFNNGVLGANPINSVESSSFPGSTATVSASGNSNGIVWNLLTADFGSKGPEVLYAHDALNVAKTLYSSAQNAPRDDAGPAVKFAVPTVFHGKVYVGAEDRVTVFGLLNGMSQAAAPVLSPVGESFQGSLQIRMSDSSPNTTIHYTTNGSAPTTSSTVYTGAITITGTMTIKAVAAGAGLLQSAITTETYTSTTTAAMPVFSPAPGSYASAQSVAISDATQGATIYYTTNGATPTTGSTKYTGPVTVSATLTLKAIAVASGLSTSPVATGTYTIGSSTTSINFANGFTAGKMVLHGSSALSGSQLLLTNNLPGEAGSAWFPTTVPVGHFTTDFVFSQTPASSSTADGMTFVVQAAGVGALGPSGGGLGYGAGLPGGTGGIPHSVAIKFDLFSNNGEGINSTGLYLNGASPTTPAVALGGNVSLHSGDPFHVHIVYNGTTLTMTITDTKNTSHAFTTSWKVNIPSAIGAQAAFVGFTAASGGHTASQAVASWTYTSP